MLLHNFSDTSGDVEITYYQRAKKRHKSGEESTTCHPKKTINCQTMLVHFILCARKHLYIASMLLMFEQCVPLRQLSLVIFYVIAGIYEKPPMPAVCDEWDPKVLLQSSTCPLKTTRPRCRSSMKVPVMINAEKTANLLKHCVGMPKTMPVQQA